MYIFNFRSINFVSLFKARGLHKRGAWGSNALRTTLPPACIVGRSIVRVLPWVVWSYFTPVSMPGADTGKGFVLLVLFVLHTRDFCMCSREISFPVRKNSYENS